MIRTFAILFLRLPGLAWRGLMRREGLPEGVRDLALALGPIYVKILQVLSTRRDILPQPYVEAFAGLRDDVPADPRTLDHALPRAFPDGVERAFAEFETTPIGSGSVCEVHRAVRHDGRRVAVKLLRPGARQGIESNFRFLRLAARLVSVPRNVRALNLPGVVRELERLLMTQTDLVHEAENIRRFRDAFADQSWIVVPTVHDDLSGPHALVMDFVEGVRPEDHATLGVDPLILAERLDDLQDMMCLVKGVCHADLHPGNFFWSREGDLVLIDFGLVCDLTQLERNHLLTFYVAVLDGYHEFAVEYFLDHFLVGGRPGDDRAALREELMPALRRHWIDSGGRPRFSAMYQEMLSVLGRRRLALDGTYSKIFLTLVTIEGFIYSLDPKFDMLENYRKKRLREAEYASVPETAERLILGDFATYSTARFETPEDPPAEAYARRDAYVLDRLGLSKGSLVLDVGCGRGAFLEACRRQGLRGFGLTISRQEHEICTRRGHETLWCSWEESAPLLAEKPKPDAMVVIEMIFHMASLHQNRTGFLDAKLARFFAWAHAGLAEDGRLFLQTLNIAPEFLTDPAHRPLFERIYRELPWLGFSTREQVLARSMPFFEVLSAEDHSSDLAPTYAFWRANVEAHRPALEEMIAPATLAYLVKELDLFIELTEAGVLRLNRILLRRA